MFAVVVTARAEHDVAAIADYLAERSPQGAWKWIDAFEEVLDVLSSRPDSCPLAPEDTDHTDTIRNALFRTPRGRVYRAIFVLRKESVYVTHVRGPGQDRAALS